MTKTKPLYNYALDAYQFMEVNAQPNKHDELVFTGSISRAIRRTGASTTYYSKIRELLNSPTDDPCIELRVRGNGQQPSTVILRHPPPVEWSEIGSSSLTRAPEAATLVQQVESLRQSLGGVNVVEALREFESRLGKLETRVSQLLQERGQTGG